MMRLSESDFAVDNRIWADLSRLSIDFSLLQGGKEAFDAFITADLIERHSDVLRWKCISARKGGSGQAGIDSGSHFFRECIG